jgi:hypothetical protein
MALLLVDGFEHYATADLLKKWLSLNGAPTIVPNAGRRGGGAFYLYGGYSYYYGGNRVYATASTLKTSSGYAGRYPVQLFDGATAQIGIEFQTDGSLKVYRGYGSAVLATSAAGVIPSNSYVYLEIKATIHPTAGAVEVRVNGATVVSVSGVNTRATSNSSVNGFGIYGISSPTYVADLYVCDGTGSTNNDFLGDVRIDTLYPNGDGTYSQFTPSTGTTHCTLVDEATPNSTDYNDGLAVGDRDSYTFTNLAALASQTIYGVQINAAVQKDDAGAKSVATMARSGSTNTDGSSKALSTSQMYVSDIYEFDPNTATAWTETSVNAAEFGVKVTA